jgi:hypothetical protein
MAAFVDLVRFAEKERSTTMSFNLSLRRRLVPGNAPEPTPENASLLFSPDILVGTRRGTEGAAVWLKNFSEVVPNMAHETVQIMDKIFGEAVALLQGSAQEMTVEDMYNIARGATDMPKPPDTPTKH